MPETDPKGFFRPPKPTPPSARPPARRPLPPHPRRAETEALRVFKPLPFGPLLGLLGIGRGLRPPATTLSLGAHFRALDADPMRRFGKLLVGLGVTVWILMIPLVRAANELASRQTSNWAALSGRYVEAEPALTPGGMILTGAAFVGFGTILLAIRRPERRQTDEDPKPAAKASGPPARITHVR
jgi:hypothetical protein